MVKPATVSTDTAFRYRSAMVSDATHEGVIPTYGIIYDEEDDEGEDEEDGVTGERVATMPRGAPCVACAARLNLARCKFKESKHAEVSARMGFLNSDGSPKAECNPKRL